MDGYIPIVDAAKLADVTRRQVDHWVKIGLIEPAITAPRGNAGTVKLLDFENLFQLLILKALIEAGFSIQALRKMSDQESSDGSVLESSDVPGDTPVKLNLARMVELFAKGEFNDLVVLVEEGLAKISLQAIHDAARESYSVYLKYGLQDRLWNEEELEQ